MSIQADLEEALQREQRYATELVYLYQIALELMSQPSNSVTDTASTVLQNMMTLLNCKDACLLLWNEAAQSLLPIYSCSTSAPSNSYWPEVDFAREIFNQRRAMVQNVPEVGSNLGVALVIKDEPIGILTAHRPAFRPAFGDNEIQLITLLASLSAVVISNVQLQKFLSERLELLQTVMAAAPSGMAVIEGGRLLMANPSALQALRLYQTDYDMPLTVDGPDGLLIERLHEVQDIPDASFEYRVQGYDGELRYLMVKPVTVGYDRELVQIDDVTLLRELESRREQAVAHTSHELKTPLAVLNLGLSNLLSYYDRMPDEDRRVMIEETLEQVNEMKGMITGLLDPARRKPNKQIFTEPTLTPDPEAVINAVVADLRPLAAMNHLSLEAVIDVSQPVRCLPSDLKTVVRNLLSNGIKYTPAGGRVHVEARTQANALVIWVEDTGVGIPAAELPRIFDQEYRASTHGTVEGNGIGLSIVQDIVTRARGRIEVQSTVGVGTLFTVALPCA